jgi:exonuclease VII large subunit
MVRVTTSIKIDDDKRELAKRKGLVLSDILDKALDFYLGIELKESTQLQTDKEEILSTLDILENEKDKYLKNHERTLQNLENEKDQFLKNYLKDHETKLQNLEDDKTEYLKNYETKKMELNYNLKNIEDSLANAIVIDKEEQKEKEYKILANMVYEEGDLDRNLDVLQVIEGYADKYDMNQEEYKELRERLYNDLHYIFLEGKYQVKGSLRYDIYTGSIIYEDE